MGTSSRLAHSSSVAFSRIDLISCVALIALFGGMILPIALAKVQGTSHTVRCLNNVKQHGLASSIQMNDVGGVPYEPWPHLWMRQLLDSHPPLREARFCPSAPGRSATELQRDPSQGGRVNRAWLVSGSGTNYQGSYGHNGYFYLNDPLSNPKLRFLGESSVSFPSETPLFTDSVWVDIWPSETDLPARNLINGDNFAGGMVRVTIPRHGAAKSSAIPNHDPADRLPGAISVVHADGHAELIQLENLWNLRWHREWKNPAKRPGLP